MSHEHLKASWRAEVEAIVRAELGKMEAELARMHHQVEQSFTQLLSQSAARLAAVSQEPSIADFAERAAAHLAALSAAVPSTSLATPVPVSEVQAPPPVEEAPAPPPAAAAPPPTVDLQALYYYLIEIQSQSTQAEVLNLLITRAMEYAPRVALFVVKSGNIVAWTERGFETSGVSLRGLTIPLEAQTTLFAALEQQMAVLDSPYAYPENQILLDRIGQAPEAIAGIPLLVRGKVAAVLYADSGDQPTERIAIPPLQILTNVAGLTVELLNARSRLATTTVPVADRATQTMAPPPATTETVPPPATVSEPQVHAASVATEPPAEAAGETSTPQESVDEATPTEVQETTYQAEPPETSAVQAETGYGAEMPAGTDISTVAAHHPTPHEAATEHDGHPAGDIQPDSAVPATVPEMGAVTDEASPEPKLPVFDPEPIPPYVAPGPTIPEPTPTPPVQFGEPAPPSTSLWPQPSPEPLPAVQPPPPPIFEPTVESGTPPPGNGVFTIAPLSAPAPQPPPPVSVAAPVAPPKPTTDEEAKAHNDARRFARLLVSEIKLYNEAKVTEGRINRDLYDRLKEDIDRSRQMYDKRVNPIVAAKFDYFYDELVSSLAEGDASRLGADCPGPVLVQPE
ncbi:hypothetical protein J8C02_05555 [Chloracidobacterium sp. MS 40/45]|uniref:hypothetical protein n=1 Tax=Chloracidobacterium aggregatum TaxID=2851959 RepID=UPI001B8AA86A|nr:hypothetical protein [Chloracidobacterium aggregatum]QUW00954.1 hypothetical protein J8C02_05555 [Chloracidobacterium sp. MS 40/45]